LVLVIQFLLKTLCVNIYQISAQIYKNILEQFAVGNWQWGVGKLQFAKSNWQIAIGNFQKNNSNPTSTANSIRSKCFSHFIPVFSFSKNASSTFGKK
jgi:hypothetical protein